MRESTCSGIRPENKATVICGFVRPPQKPLGPREAFIAAYGRVKDLAGISPSDAFIIAAVDPTGRVLGALPMSNRSALIVGRHSRCAFILPHEGVSLRHLAVLVRSEGLRPTVHVWDLNTHVPFIMEDGQGSSAVVADGPVYAAVGQYALWIVPAGDAVAWPGRAADAWDSIPPRHFVDRRGAQRIVRTPPVASSALPPAPPHRKVTQVTIFGPPLLIGEGDAPEVGWGVLRFEQMGQKEKRYVSAERLAQGLLIGRYDRCGMTFGRRCLSGQAPRWASGPAAPGAGARAGWSTPPTRSSGRSPAGQPYARGPAPRSWRRGTEASGGPRPSATACPRWTAAKPLGDWTERTRTCLRWRQFGERPSSGCLAFWRGTGPRWVIPVSATFLSCGRSTFLSHQRAGPT